MNNITIAQRKNLEFYKIDIRNFYFLKYDLINAFNVLSFLSKDDINIVVSKIVKSLKSEGIAILTFFGQNDMFPNDKVSKYKIEELLTVFSSNEINICESFEREYDALLASNKMKHWDIITIVIKKK